MSCIKISTQNAAAWLLDCGTAFPNRYSVRSRQLELLPRKLNAREPVTGVVNSRNTGVIPIDPVVN
jgi:hypothetical protein